MPGQSHSSLAFIVNSPPYRKRAARGDIDLALAAAALDFELQVFFVGSSILQLAADRKTADALLPPGSRAWAALPDLAETRFFIEERWRDYCEDNRVELLFHAEALSPSEMKRAWRNCRYVMVV